MLAWMKSKYFKMFNSVLTSLSPCWKRTGRMWVFLLFHRCTNSLLCLLLFYLSFLCKLLDSMISLMPFGEMLAWCSASFVLATWHTFFHPHTCFLYFLSLNCCNLCKKCDLKLGISGLTIVFLICIMLNVFAQITFRVYASSLVEIF